MARKRRTVAFTYAHPVTSPAHLVGEKGQTRQLSPADGENLTRLGYGTYEGRKTEPVITDEQELSDDDASEDDVLGPAMRLRTSYLGPADQSSGKDA